MIAYPAWSIDCVTAVVGFSTYSSAKGRDSSLYDLIYSTNLKERSPGAFGLSILCASRENGWTIRLC